MSQIINRSLKDIAKGTAIVLLSGTIAGLLEFGGKVLVGRFFPRAEYGIFSLALTVLNIAITVSVLGVEQGSGRQIAYYRGKGDTEKVRGIVSAALKVVLVTSVLISVVLFFTSSLISVHVFHDSGLTLPLQIVSVTLPFSALLCVLPAIFRGFDEVKPKAYFQDITQNVLFPLLLLPVILLSLSFLAGMYAFSASIIVTCIVLIIYAYKKAPFTLKLSIANSLVTNELLVFSLPLLAVTTSRFVLHWVDTLMLGYFTTVDMVGLYNAAVPLAWLIPMALTAMAFIYVPIASGLYSRNLQTELKRVYQVLTKWIFAISFPLFLLLFLFPETILTFFFGVGYAKAAMALRLLSLGLMIQTSVGTNAVTLIVMGKVRLVMWASFLAAGLNILLNAVLIPHWGINGAATASLLSYAARNIFCSVKLYQLSNIHPFTKSYIKPFLACCGIVAIIYLLAKSLLVVTWWMLPIIFILFIVIYGLSLVLTRSFDKEDIMIILAIGKRMQLNLEPITKRLEKFL